MIQNKLRSHCVRVPNSLTLSLFFVLLLVVPDSAAQQANVPAGQQPSGAGENRRNEFGIWGGISFDAPTWIGKTPDARFGNIGLRYGRVLAANDSLAFSWTIDAVPVAVLSVNRFTIVPTGSGSFTVQRRREHTYGAGLSPIGLKLNFRRAQMLQPFASGTAGFLYFSKDVPVPGPHDSTSPLILAAGLTSLKSRAVRLLSDTSTNISPMVIARQSIRESMCRCSMVGSRFLNESYLPDGLRMVSICFR